jgi:rod shape-determining protein MreC
MNSIFKYLRSKLHIVLFILLEVFCIIIIIRFNVYHSSFFFSHTRQLTAKLHEVNNSAFDYFGLYAKNQALSNENIELRKKLKSNFVLETRNVFEINDTVFKQRYRYYPAQVITNSTNKQNNFITINRGKTSGIKVNMGVFSPEGIIGTIIEVSENYSIATSVLNVNGFKIVPKITELNYTKGTIVWNGKDPNYLMLEGINKYESLKKGYHIVTSPYSKFFPENIPIGIVESIERPSDKDFFNVKVRTAVNLSLTFSRMKLSSWKRRLKTTSRH